MKNSSGTMLDLSFLTEEEYEKLMKVLQRDAELQKKDSDRIRRLQGSLKDEKKKKFVTGEWFKDVKSRRFQEDLQGSDLLRASIRKKRNTTHGIRNGRGDDFKEAIYNLSTHMEHDSQGQQSLVDSNSDRSPSVPRLQIDASAEPESSAYYKPEKASPETKKFPEQGRMGNDYPEDKVASKASNVSNARSMVNIYTSTETYNKPSTLSHQLLEPERAKELSRSTPALHSETESDTASEISFNFKRHRKTLSSGSNSSDMASVSSVSNSVLSVYSGDFGSVDAQGTVQFSLDYDEKNREFQIYVSQCRDLAVVDEKKGRSDPYVKTYLLPDKARMGKRKTSVKRKTTNPIYNEVLRYKIEKMVLLIQKLNLSVWHNDPLGRNSFLGELEIDLTSWDWSNRKPNWYTLKPRSLSAMNGLDHLGVMNLSIKYIPPGTLGPKRPASGEVHIWVKDTKDLPQLRPSGVDSFVKCYVLPDTSKKSYQKTRVIKKDINPVFNHTIVYDGFHTEDLKDACVELTVWDHEKLSNHFLGGIRLGFGSGYSYGIAVDWMDSTQEEVALWHEMTVTPNEWVEGSLPLRSLAGRRKFK
ncbi:synaptotagmin-like protein 2 isoform X2 [Engystomops pustulosus]|uniref:synaptotagmin-like protein 2 isoform X2 n=1 Tax=Engystomops pustulosus TaxID=76066 RepID=UPI003AFB5A12